MKCPPFSSPTHVAVAMLFGSFVSASGCVAKMVTHRPLSLRAHVLPLSLVLLGFTITVIAGVALQIGIRRGWWPVDSVRTLRANVNAAAFKALWYFVYVFMLALFAPSRFRAIGFIALILASTFALIRAIAQGASPRPG